MPDMRESTAIDDALLVAETLVTLVDKLAVEREQPDIAVPRKKLTELARKIEYVAAHELFEGV